MMYHIQTVAVRVDTKICWTAFNDGLGTWKHLSGRRDMNGSTDEAYAVGPFYRLFLKVMYQKT